MIIKSPALCSNKLHNASKNQQYPMQIRGVCNSHPDTVVPSHTQSSHMVYLLKVIYTWVVDCCSNCHDVTDGRVLFE
ncbi:DUF1364 family protein [Photobacterium damselae]|nr:DUF1364 family protein [Photobacterium damselae]